MINKFCSLQITCTGVARQFMIWILNKLHNTNLGRHPFSTVFRANSKLMAIIGYIRTSHISTKCQQAKETNYSLKILRVTDWRMTNGHANTRSVVSSTERLLVWVSTWRSTRDSIVTFATTVVKAFWSKLVSLDTWIPTPKLHRTGVTLVGSRSLTRSRSHCTRRNTPVVEDWCT